MEIDSDLPRLDEPNDQRTVMDTSLDQKPDDHSQVAVLEAPHGLPEKPPPAQDALLDAQQTDDAATGALSLNGKVSACVPASCILTKGS